MLKYLNTANNIHRENSVYRLEEAYRTLSIAKGVYYTLFNLGLLEEDKHSAEDIDRVENKINYFLEEKLRRKKR